MKPSTVFMDTAFNHCQMIDLHLLLRIDSKFIEEPSKLFRIYPVPRSSEIEARVTPTILRITSLYFFVGTLRRLSIISQYPAVIFKEFHVHAGLSTMLYKRQSPGRTCNRGLPRPSSNGSRNAPYSHAYLHVQWAPRQPG